MHPLQRIDMWFARFMPPITRMAFYICVVVFLLTHALGLGNLLFALFMLEPTNIFPRFMIWQFLTYGFLHGNFGHLFMNMLALFFFGAPVELALGRRRYLRMLIVAVMAAGFAHTLWYFGNPVGLVGFSAAVFAILAGCLILIPNQTVYLYALLPVKMKWLVIAYLIFETASFASGARTGVSQLGHLTGALVGFAFVLGPRFINRRKGGGGGKGGGKRVKSKVITMGHPGRSAKASDLYDDPHWRLDQ